MTPADIPAEAGNRFRRIAVFGVGLIGGSLGLALKKLDPTIDILGVDDPKVLDLARKRGVIDRGLELGQIEGGLAEIDLVILSTPVSAIPELLELVGKEVRSGTVITDTGSTKARIMESAKLLPPEVSFIGGHPMAGSERRGLEAADPFLFENAVYVLCQAESVPDDTFKSLAALMVGIGARVKPLDAGLHDRIAAYTSHLPQLVALSLVNILGRSENDSGDYFALAAGGFRGLTRIADSPADIWADICRTNSEFITEVVHEFKEELDRIAANLLRPELADDFGRARDYRRRLPKDTRGFLNPLYDLMVEVTDRPGILSTITTSLYDKGLNIKDIEVLKIREGTSGVLRLGFEDQRTRQEGETILSSLGYRCWSQE
ncbi:prephenate dehydrogenase/arogenate dehydrogenase family protein [candidate division KSB1 bacterium]